MTEKPLPPRLTDSSLLVTLLRSLRGWSQSELAEAAGVEKRTIRRFESGESRLTPEKLGVLCAAVGLPPAFARHGLLPMLRLSLELAAGRRRPPSDSLYDEAEAIGEEIGDRLGAVAKTRLVVLLAEAERSWDERVEHYPPRHEHREAAREAWQALKAHNREERAFLLDAAEELWNWALTELLCVESGRRSGGAGAGNAERADLSEAEELAGLALAVAERAFGEEAWKARLQGYATAFVANVLCVKGDLAAADRTLARAWALWNAGGSAPCPLEEWRLLEIEANLRRAQGRFEEALVLQERVLKARTQAAEGAGFEPGVAQPETQEEGAVN